jgi:CRISPR system Cascade subunit CasA
MGMKTLPRPRGATTDVMFNLLETPSIRVLLANGQQERLTLPGVLAALARDDIATFPGLRAHQRHAWHSFLCQLAALALLCGKQVTIWQQEAEWRMALRALTPEHIDDAPWSLVAPFERPALLQPSGPDDLRKTIATPDALDMLVTSRNHELKSAVMVGAQADDWLFALVTLQTMEGFLGAGNYGISRMNGGFASRPAMSVAPQGGPGAHFSRDVNGLLRLRGQTPGALTYPSVGGLALLWLAPWDGTSSLQPKKLDEFYIEICRRVRLVERDGSLFARADGSKAARVAGTGGGLTGDAWAPLMEDGDGRKVFTINAAGLNYRRMVKLMWPPQGNAAPLQGVAPNDADTGLTLIARALARGQGKTEGYHERHVALSKRTKRMAVESTTDPLAATAEIRVKIAEQIGRVLRTALLLLFQGGPERVDERDKDGLRKAQPFLDRFDAAVDRGFFEDLRREAETADDHAAHVERTDWTKGLLAQAETLLCHADHAAPKATRRRLRARVRAQGAMKGLPFHNPVLRPYFIAEVADAV